MEPTQTDNERLLRLLLRRRRNCVFAVAWGLVCCLAGLMYLLFTLNGPDTPVMNALSVLSVVLLACGLSVMGLGALSWLFVLVGMPARDRTEGRPAPAPPPAVRLGLLAWVVLGVVILAAFFVYVMGA